MVGAILWLAVSKGPGVRIVGLARIWVLARVPVLGLLGWLGYGWGDSLVSKGPI